MPVKQKKHRSFAEIRTTVTKGTEFESVKMEPFFGEDFDSISAQS